jgi:hypothetical protein
MCTCTIACFFFALVRGEFLYLTLHGDKHTSTHKHASWNNVYAWDLESGAYLGGVLDTLGLSTHMLRGMAIDPMHRLYVANAYKGDSRILLFGDCTAKNHTREYVSTLASSENTPELVHPYGLTIGPMAFEKNMEPALYASSQDTEMVLVFSLHAPLSYNVVIRGLSNVRGIAFDPCHFLYVGSKSGVTVYDVLASTAPVPVHRLNITKVIRVYVRPGSSPSEPFIVFASSKADDSVHSWLGSCPFDGAAPHLRSFHTYTHPTLSHPAGLVSMNSILFVVNQNKNEVVRFDISSGAFLGVFCGGLPDSPEALLISSC